MRILIVKPSSLGDVVHALPTVNLIRRRFPDAHMSWVINDTLAPLLKHCPLIDELILFRRGEFARLSNLPRFFQFLRVLREKRFDRVIDLQCLFRSGLMSWATGAPERFGLADAREGARVFYTELVPVTRCHDIDRYLLLARHLGCGSTPVEFPLGTSADDEAYVDSLVGNARSLIGVNPSARWKTKLWGDESFARLIERLPRDRVVVSGSAEDALRIGAIARGCLNVAGKTTLTQLAELYRRCAVLITNDSGPMHVAVAVGTPAVAIFGPTDPELSGPYGKGNVVVRSGVSCSPCESPRCANRVRMECMKRVSVEQVLAAVEPYLAAVRAP
jgi:heptosyltransferase-1